MRATSRLCEVSIKTVTKLLIDVGAACDLYQSETLRNLPCKRIQCDEVELLLRERKESAGEVLELLEI